MGANVPVFSDGYTFEKVLLTLVGHEDVLLAPLPGRLLGFLPHVLEHLRGDVPAVDIRKLADARGLPGQLGR